MNNNCINIVLGSKIRSIRRRKKISQEKLADMIGVSRTTVLQWESGKTNLTMPNMYKLSEALDINVGDIMPDKKDDGEIKRMHDNLKVVRNIKTIKSQLIDSINNIYRERDYFSIDDLLIISNRMIEIKQYFKGMMNFRERED